MSCKMEMFVNLDLVSNFNRILPLDNMKKGYYNATDSL